MDVRRACKCLLPVSVPPFAGVRPFTTLLCTGVLPFKYTDVLVFALLSLALLREELLGGSKLLRRLPVPLDGEHDEKALEPSSLLEQLLLLLVAV